MHPYIPYRTYTFHTPLSDADIRKAVETHAHIGTWDGMFIKSKPYNAEIATGHISVRACGTHKKYGYSPAMVVLFTPQQTGSQRAEVTLKPHGLLVALGVPFVGISLYLLAANIVGFFGNWDVAPIIVSLGSTAMLAGCFALPYHFSAQKTVHFWSQELRLAPV